MKKVSEADLLEIQSLKESLSEIIYSIGELTINKFLLSSQLQEIETLIDKETENFKKFQENERVLYEKLQQNYGTGSINIETGEIAE